MFTYNSYTLMYIRHAIAFSIAGYSGCEVSGVPTAIKLLEGI